MYLRPHLHDRTSFAILCAFVIAACLGTAAAAEQGQWAGEYADKKFLNGQAVFQLSITEQGGAVDVAFDAVYSDGHGAAPEAQGRGKITGKGTLEFQFQDSFGNTGTGKIVRSGKDVILSIKPAKVADPRCLVFYKENMRLTAAGKK